MQRSLLVLLALLMMAPVLFGKNAKAELYRRWNDQCMTDDTGQIDAHLAVFEKQLAADAKDHLARVYLGSGCALRAKASFWGPTKLKYLKRGQALMDAAVAGAPKDPRVRMVRAIGYYKVPKRFGTRPTSLSDFEFLLPIVKDPKGRLEVNERQVILYYAWQIFSEEGKAGAGELKKACHRLDPRSKYGKLTK